MRIWSKLRFSRKLKQFASERNLERILKHDWSGYPELALFFRDLDQIL